MSQTTYPNVAELQDRSGSDLVDWGTFEQILEMDEDEEEREFSTGIVLNFFEQADSIVAKMEQALKDKDLATLSSLGHFLKGSSAALGFTKVTSFCEKLQHLGDRKDEAGNETINNPETSLKLCTTNVITVSKEIDLTKAYLKNYYANL